MKLNTKQIGDIAELRVMARFIELGYYVSIPHGDIAPYDMLVEYGDADFQRVQVKTGRLVDGKITFVTTSCNARMERKNYRGTADKFAVFCPENERCYLVDVDEAPIGGEMILRVDPPRNNQKIGINWAKDYQL